MKRLASAGIAAFLLGLIGLAVFAGWPGVLGYLLGVVSTAGNLVATWFFLGLTARSAISESPRAASFWTGFGVLTAMPAWAACAIIAVRMGEPVSTGFMIGIGLVYFGLVGWALARR